MRQVIHALLTRPPLSHPSVRKLQGASFDLHVLSTPPAFILSQDQTLMLKFVSAVKTCWSLTSVYCYFWVGLLKTMFFKNSFSKNFQGFMLLFSYQCPSLSLATAYLDYHIHFLLSITFFYFFRFFCYFCNLFA